MSRNLPAVSENDVVIWDEERNRCGGFLSKKASQSSAFSKGKWQKRWFGINLELEPHENYQLAYYHSPDEKTPRSTFPLHGASIKIAGDTNFVLSLSDGTPVSLNAENPNDMKHWVQTLEKVISTSNLRERLQFQRREIDDDGDYERDEADDNVSPLDGQIRKNRKNRAGYVKNSYAQHLLKRKWPTVRLDFDVSSIPAGSPERLEFEDEFCQDIATALSLDQENVQIISLRPAPGMEWLCLVEFDFHVRGEDWEAESSGSVLSTSDVKRRLLEALNDMLRDPSSILFRGFITSRLDASYADHLLPDQMQSSKRGSPIRAPQHEVDIFSTDAKVLQTMLKYKDVVVPEDFEDLSHFTITIMYDSRAVELRVPNPAVLRPASACFLWPFEVKQALGFMHTMQELWVEPLELALRDAASKSEARPIVFTPSHRAGNLPVINTLLLRPNAIYDLHCEDKRDEAVNALSAEEMDAIKETFHRFDRNNDGGISKDEMKLIVRERTAERKAQIDKKFQKFISENELTQEELASAEANKARYLQQISEAQTRLMQMFEAADLDGDGTITITEFILAEAWWQRCTINPDRAHLF